MLQSQKFFSGPILKAAISTIALGFLISCASAPRAEIPDTANANEEAAKLDADIQQGYERHYDVLATDDFKYSQRSLTAAKERMKDGDDQHKIIRELAESRGYLDRAAQTSQNNAGKLSDVLNARTAAIQAGARNYPKERENLVRIDKDLRDEVASIDDMDSGTYGKLQKRYMDLELGTIQTVQLGDVRAAIEGLEKAKAEKRIPNTLKKTREDLVTAENMIASNVRNPSQFEPTVKRAKDSAGFAMAVMEESKKGGDKMPESAAVAIVMQDRKITSLNDKLADRTDELNSSKLTESEQQRLLRTQGTSIALTNMIKTLSSEFDKKDAEVYRQGDKLLIRLKGIKFKSGGSQLPGETIPLLGKVKDAADQLNASEVTVEGHTDAVGTASLNKDLSQKRAESVAQYLSTNGVDSEAIHTVGYGFEKPIANNKTKNGRAQNRRVDILITPNSVAKDSSESQPAIR